MPAILQNSIFRALPGWAEACELAAIVTIGAIYLLRLQAYVVAPIFDQAALLEHPWQPFPILADGVVSVGLGAIARLLGGTLPISDLILRSMALLLFHVSHYLLIRALVSSRALRALLLTVILVSPFPFLWLSSELFASAFLALTLWSFLTERDLLIQATLLTLYALTKPDVILPAVALAVVVAWQHPSWRERAAMFLILVSGLMGTVLGGTILLGRTFLDLQSRSWISFVQHYADLVAPHQRTLGPNPNLYWHAYTDRAWPTAHSVRDVVTSTPSLYLDFVGLSASRSLQYLWLAGVIPLILAGILAWRWTSPSAVRRLAVTPLIGVVPQVLFSYVDVRYTPRITTCLLVVLALGLRTALSAERQTRLLVLTALAMSVSVWLFWPWVSALAIGSWCPDCYIR